MNYRVKKCLSGIKWYIDMKLLDVFASILFVTLRGENIPRQQKAIFKVDERRWWFNPLLLPVTREEALLLESMQWRLPTTEELLELNKNVDYDTTETGSVIIKFAKGCVCFLAKLMPGKKDILPCEPITFWTGCRDEKGDVGSLPVCELADAETGFQPFRGEVEEVTTYESRVILVSRNHIELTGDEKLHG